MNVCRRECLLLVISPCGGNIGNHTLIPWAPLYNHKQSFIICDVAFEFDNQKHSTHDAKHVTIAGFITSCLFSPLDKRKFSFLVFRYIFVFVNYKRWDCETRDLTLLKHKNNHQRKVEYFWGVMVWILICLKYGICKILRKDLRGDDDDQICFLFKYSRNFVLINCLFKWMSFGSVYARKRQEFLQNLCFRWNECNGNYILYNRLMEWAPRL